MKEIRKEIPTINEGKKKIIFQVLNKKRHLDYGSKDYYQSNKKTKKLFILQKPINYNNINILNNNKEINIFNENNININLNLNNILRNSLTKNILNYPTTTTPVTAETNNPTKINGTKKEDFNKMNNHQDTEIKNNDDNNKQNIVKKQFGDYICFNEDKIGSGSFGEVLYGYHKNTYREVAVKILNSDTSQDNIKREITLTRQLQGSQGFPSLYYCGVFEKKNIIVESLLGPSLDKLFKFCGKIFPLKTVCLIGIELVKRLETMHNKGIIHRDLKPNNLAWGNFNNSYNNIFLNNNNYNYNNINNYDKLDINTIYLIDFGLSCSYWDNSISQRHYKLINGLNFVGTLRYASLNSHKGIRQSRRDDLESLLYILIYFLKGKLPWQDVKAKNKEERYKVIQQIKTKVSIESLCENIPSEFAELLIYIKSLEFNAKPNYYKFYFCFQSIINKLHFEQTQEKNYNYIWEKMLVDYINKYEQDNDNRILDEIKNIIFKGYPINLKNFAKYITHNMNESCLKKKENFYLGDSTESMESYTFLK